MSEKTLILMRHGHAAMMQGQSDHDRPLTEQGESAVKLQSEKLKFYLSENVWLFYSDANRTTTTAKIVVETCDDVFKSSEARKDLYLADYDQVLTTIAEIPEIVKTVLLIGHNPGWSGIASMLSRKYLSLDPSEAAVIKTSDTQSWVDSFCTPGGWTLEKHLKVKI